MKLSKEIPRNDSAPRLPNLVHYGGGNFYFWKIYIKSDLYQPWKITMKGILFQIIYSLLSRHFASSHRLVLRPLVNQVLNLKEQQTSSVARLKA